MKTHKIIQALLIVTALSAMQYTSANTLDISSNLANINAWKFSDGSTTIPTCSDTVTSFCISPPNFNYAAPANNTYSGNNLLSDSNYHGFWSATFTFWSSLNQPAGIVIPLFSADDRAQVWLNGINGQLIDSAGLFAKSEGSTGYFQNSYPGTIQSDVPFTSVPGLYDDGNCVNNGIDCLPLARQALKYGYNTIEVIINNTNHGIGNTGDGTGRDLTTAGPTHFTLQGTITTLNGPVSIPPVIDEPPTLFLALIGLLAFAYTGDRQRIVSRRIFI